jgi:hypothetical protein
MLRAVSRLILVAGAAALGAAGAVMLRPDLLVGYGLGRAMEAQRAISPFELATQAVPLAKAEVGDEGYWLTRNPIEHRAPFGSRIAAGDRITIAGRGGRARTLEVVDLKVIGAPLLRIAADGASVRLVQVTARVIGAEELVRFYIEAEEPKPAASPEVQPPLGRT